MSPQHFNFNFKLNMCSMNSHSLIAIPHPKSTQNLWFALHQSRPLTFIDCCHNPPTNTHIANMYNVHHLSLSAHSSTSKCCKMHLSHLSPHRIPHFVSIYTTNIWFYIVKIMLINNSISICGRQYIYKFHFHVKQINCPEFFDTHTHRTEV